MPADTIRGEVLAVSCSYISSQKSVCCLRLLLYLNLLELEVHSLIDIDMAYSENLEYNTQIAVLPGSMISSCFSNPSQVIILLHSNSAKVNSFLVCSFNHHAS